MAKTIQIRIDDDLKESADILFASLGMDTSTAVRIFLKAALDAGGIPFAVTRKSDNDFVLREAINYRKAGGELLTAEQSLEYLRTAIKAGVNHGKQALSHSY